MSQSTNQSRPPVTFEDFAGHKHEPTVRDLIAEKIAERKRRAAWDRGDVRPVGAHRKPASRK